MAALIRTLARGGPRIHIFGVEAHASSRGGDELFALVRDVTPSAVLMESFASPDAVETGATVPYRRHLHPLGLQKAAALVGKPQFRERLTCEAVGVLAAVRAGAEVRFADRLHVVSFDRLVARLSVEETLTKVAQAAEAFAGALEQASRLCRTTQVPWAQDILLQNAICPVFPELWDERHMVMAGVARQATAESERDVVLVVGSKHVAPVYERLEKAEEGKQSSVENLLMAPEDAASFQDQIEKRAALTALVVSTRAFPAEYLLPPFDELLPEAKDFARPVYLRCRQAIRERLGSFESSGNPAEKLGASQVIGLSQIEELCVQLAKET